MIPIEDCEWNLVAPPLYAESPAAAIGEVKVHMETKNMKIRFDILISVVFMHTE